MPEPAGDRRRRSANLLLDAASREAESLGQTWLGPEHLLLAPLGRSSSAVQNALSAAGVTYDAVRASVAAERVEGEAASITPNPAAHDLLGFARGVATASSRPP